MNTWIEIKKEALINNYRLLKETSGTASLCPVIKSNAYGHGLKLVYSALEEVNSSWLGVNYIEEGENLRKWGYKGRILIVGPIFKEELSKASKLDLDIVIGNSEVLRSWGESNQKAKIHLKIDSGMSRQGFYQDELQSLIPLLKKNAQFVVGVCSHFANVEDVTEYSYPNRQLQYFETTTAFLKKNDLNLLEHIASSASSLIMPESQHQLVRTGISLYGFWPSIATKLSYSNLHQNLLPLEPSLSWYSRVSQVKVVPKGNFIGYGCTYKTLKDTKIAVIPVGYFEGFPRQASDNSASHVLINQTRCQILGRICMNMMMVDISHLSNCEYGDLVTLIGKDGEEIIGAKDIGEWCHTIHYEIVTRINPLIERRLV